MATKKPAIKPKTTTKKKVVKAAKPSKGKVAAKKPLTKKKIELKPARPAPKSVKKTDKKAMAKLVVDRIPLPKGGKLFVKAAKRPVSKKTAKKK